ncbi:hypothetical protein NQ318_008772 [Aromia moschata]|uniref:C2 domain-containing protein n=1 Tax=Aromia moschata TaxID=1265417 RepID=A0AAV8ZAW0_9CUCU|nr:hypothetical protein NQ318_008772 [Aromia moschata]
MDMILHETQMLRASNLNTSLLTIFLDSAKNLPQARASTKPDPYAVIKVGNKTQQTNFLMRTIHPVWEHGFTFLVANPENDSIFLSIIDHKTSSEIGNLVFKIKNLCNKVNLEISKEPFTLTKSGPDSKLIWSVHLRILKRTAEEQFMTDSPAELERTDSNISTPSMVERQTSTEKEKEPAVAPADDALKLIDGEVQEVIEESSASFVNSAPSSQNSETLLHRTPSVTSSAGEAGLGRIKMTLRYSYQMQKLIVVIHNIMNIPIKDPSNIPDPYVKLYLLPERAKDTKRKTQVIKDNCNPIFDERFEYVLNPAELVTKQLEITVGTQKQLFYSSSNVLGQVIIDLGKLNLSQPYSGWFDLQPEIDHD